MDVSDRRMQVQLTQEAKIASDFHFIRAIFAVVGFVSALGGAQVRRAPLSSPQARVFCASGSPFGAREGSSAPARCSDSLASPGPAIS